MVEITRTLQTSDNSRIDTGRGWSTRHFNNDGNGKWRGLPHECNAL